MNYYHNMAQSSGRDNNYSECASEYTQVRFIFSLSKADLYKVFLNTSLY